MWRREVYEAAVTIRSVLKRDDADAIRLAQCLSPGERDDLAAAARHPECVVAIAGIVCRAQMRTNVRLALLDAELHRKLIEQQVPVPSGADARQPRVRMAMERREQLAAAKRTWRENERRRKALPAVEDG